MKCFHVAREFIKVTKKKDQIDSFKKLKLKLQELTLLFFNRVQYKSHDDFFFFLLWACEMINGITETHYLHF